MNIIRLDHVQICIPNGEEERAHRFYTDRRNPDSRD
jgi:hypothetical protein